jgi:hypothetical protein
MLLNNSHPFPVGSTDPAQHQPATVGSATPRRSGTILAAALAMPTGAAPARHPSDRIAAYLRRLMQDHFFGNVTITIRDGRIEVIRTDQSLKLVGVPNTPAPGVTATALGATTAVDGGIR